MKLLQSAVAVVLALGPVTMAVAQIDARSVGMAGAGIASGDYTHANLNPALLTRFQDDDDLYVKFSLGAHASDYQDTIDQVDALQLSLDQFESLVANPDLSNPPTAEAQALVADLKALDSSQIDGEGGLDLAFYLPSDTLAIGFSMGGQVWAKGDFSFAKQDETLINNALTTGEFDQQNIRSEGLARAVVVSELAVSVATQVSLPVIGSLALGVTPKLQRFDSYVYRANINNYDSDDYFDDQYMTDTTGANLDFGVHGAVGPLQVGLVARNLIAHELVNVANERLRIEPTVTAAIAMQTLGFTLALDIDLIEDKSFVLDNNPEAFMQPRQWARFGAEFDLFEQVQLRGGYRTDMTGHYSDEFSVGIGASPFDVVTLDLAAQFGGEDAIGAALQLGVKF
ncbi:conjugal transfer protein TraF [Shewanella sp. NIFS-20-20]|uniref:conjugal transfer protein TraF n=1 Tax=Shewanella sp. NIFS-20-20 TaxID=2853806 RepID=UPI001C4539E6|nr:conjugal transfer protein TraF [Shewanella sp. NIFS-20-20]MBV7315787.1 conjugal transfer protein TraF [Shewanella sp. NIFS-20-20]